MGTKTNTSRNTRFPTLDHHYPPPTFDGQETESRGAPRARHDAPFVPQQLSAPSPAAPDPGAAGPAPAVRMDPPCDGGRGEGDGEGSLHEQDDASRAGPQPSAPFMPARVKAWLGLVVYSVSEALAAQIQERQVGLGGAAAQGAGDGGHCGRPTLLGGGGLGGAVRAEIVPRWRWGVAVMCCCSVCPFCPRTGYWFFPRRGAGGVRNGCMKTGRVNGRFCFRLPHVVGVRGLRRRR